MNKTKKWITYLAAAVLLTVIIPITAGASKSARGNSARGNAPAPTKPPVGEMSTGVCLNSTAPSFFCFVVPHPTTLSIFFLFPFYFLN